MFRHTKIVGLNSDQQAAQLLILDRQPQTSFFLLLTAITDDAFSKTKQVLQQAEDLLTDSEEAVGPKITKALEFIADQMKESEEWSGLVAALHEQAFYYITHGKDVAIFLARDSKVSELTKLSSHQQLVSGFVKESDRVIITTRSTEEILKDQWEKIAQWPLAEVEDEVSALLPAAHVDPLATLVVDYGEPQPVAIPESPAEDDIHFHKPQITKKMGMILGGVLVLALLGFAGYSYFSTKDSARNGQVQAYIQQAETEFQLAKAGDPSHLELARQALAQALQIDPANSQAQSLQKQIDSEAPGIMKIYTVSDFPVWLDLNLVKKNFFATQLSTSVGSLLVLDPSQKTLVSLDLAKKSNQILAGQDKLGDAKLASLNGTAAFVYSGDKGLLRVEKDVSTAVKSDEKWGNITDIYAFASNIYLLDPSKNSIWKHVPTASGYAEARNYLTGEEDLSGSQRMQIDSSVWVLKKDGSMLKFTQGAPDYFSYTGLDKPIDQPKSFFVSSDTDSLYLLDSGNNRLVVMDKKGVYQAQYQGEQFKDFTDLVVDEENKKIYLLSGQKIFQIDLK